MSADLEIALVEELRRKYGLFSEDRPQLRLDADHVPRPLHHLISVAETFGVADDIMREDLRGKLSTAVFEDIQKQLGLCEDALDEWLAGPEADSRNPTDEYVAFSALRMLVDGC
jgi:hypothetical protein